jgi:hypothetical protein
MGRRQSGAEKVSICRTVLPKLQTGELRLVAFYPGKVLRSLDSVVRVKPIWSADNRANIITYLAGGPVYQPLKRLMHILNAGIQQRATVI